MAAELGHKDVVSLLLDRGADIELKAITYDVSGLYFINYINVVQANHSNYTSSMVLE
jgi:hypothetical protein